MAFGTRILRPVAWAIVMICVAGCTSWRDYVQNGFKVGPNYCRPAAPVAQRWIDEGDPAVKSVPAENAAWWRTFHDPVLDGLVETAYRQNLTLRVAGLRILEARAQRAIAAGELFPQTQQAFGGYTRNAGSQNAANPSVPFFNDWATGANLAWELDFWGRFRRAVESADASLDVSIENYDDALVLLLAEVAQSYVDLRTAEERLQYATKNSVVQAGSLYYARIRFKEGKVPKLDETQGQSNLSQTQATIPPLKAARRQAANQLCILLGMPPGSLEKALEDAEAQKALKEMEDVLQKQDLDRIKAVRQRTIEKAIPTAPVEVAVGIPADLLRRRPDVRRAEREVAAQSAQIGIAAAELYPHFSITGTIFLDATRFQDLFQSGSVAGSVGPSFRWNILNYGRLVNNIRVQDARFEQLAVTYQNLVLQANAEAENALVGFLQAQQQVKYLQASTDAAGQSLGLVEELYQADKTDFNRVFNVQQLLTQQEDQLAAAEGSVARNLIQLYRALGGGWQIRLGGAGSAPDVVGGTGVSPVSDASTGKMPEPILGAGGPRSSAVAPVARRAPAAMISGVRSYFFP